MKKNFFKSVFILLVISSIGFYACSEDAPNTKLTKQQLQKELLPQLL
jgi:hypothetical protein